MISIQQDSICFSSMNTSTQAVTVSDYWVQHPLGRVFVRRWNPAQPTEGRNPIVLMHDSLGCVELWRDLPEALCQATGREVIAYDRLGFGRSDALTSLPELDFIGTEAHDLFQLVCREMSVEGFVIMGHSVGGGMSVHIAAAYPDRSSALITLSAQSFAEALTLDGVRKARVHFREPEQIQRLSRYHGDKSRWVVDAWTESWLHPDFADWSLLDVLPKVSCPVLAIHGQEDEYGSVRHPELIGQHAGGSAQVETLAGVGHLPHREQPQTVLKQVAGLLQSVG